MAEYTGSLMFFVGSGATRTPLAYSTSAKIDISTGSIKTSNKDSGNWETSRPGRNSWSGSVDGLLSFDAISTGTTVFNQLIQYQLNRTTLGVVFSGALGTFPNWTSDSTNDFTGNAFITNISLSSPDNDQATYSVSFEGVGSLTY